ncbi:hypothetical protein PG993_000787 [Apiospora rasikravindrae]|uniref:Uncharacterized protein n=1 Tax=Apiospora rasikravindrae TaxID=990691 RepID=A0ABR1U9K1_9PEZI
MQSQNSHESRPLDLAKIAHECFWLFVAIPIILIIYFAIIRPFDQKMKKKRNDRSHNKINPYLDSEMRRATPCMVAAFILLVLVNLAFIVAVQVYSMETMEPYLLPLVLLIFGIAIFGDLVLFLAKTRSERKYLRTQPEADYMEPEKPFADNNDGDDESSMV